jgi:hypothetical protein
MRQNTMDTPGAEDRADSMAPQYPLEQTSPVSVKGEATCSTLGSAALAAQCLGELSTYRRGEPCTETYGLELLRRATVQADPEAWAWVRHCFRELVLDWLHRHPSREAACRLESEEHYVAQAFERFCQATTVTQRVEFSRLAPALQYLRASLNGALLNRLRACSRPGVVSLQEPGEPPMEDHPDSSELWEILQTLLPNKREQRLASLLFHCGLSPREIVRCCPQEWSDIQEIYRLRHTIMERVLP